MANAETKPQGRAGGLDGYHLLSVVAARAYVALEHGRLIIKPTSGKSVPSEWLAQNKQALLAQIATLTNQPLYSYVGYSTQQKYPSICVQFTDVTNPQQKAFTFYNVARKYQRSSKDGKHKKGDTRPEGHFGLPEGKWKFNAFWQRTGIQSRRRPSEIYRDMPKLKTLYFTLEGEKEVNGDVHADKDTVRPVSISYEAIKHALTVGQHRDNVGTREGQGRDKERGQASPQSKALQQLQSKSSTGAKMRGNTLIRYHGNTGAIPSSTTGTGQANQQIQDQSMDEWLAAYDSYHIH